MLPTEAQWEYACRAGTTTMWHCGDSEAALQEHAWFAANSAGKTRPVGGLKPNAWGLHDMHGNVQEWCADRYGTDYYRQAALSDPTGPKTGKFYAFRGGDFSGSAGLCRSASRSGGSVGFRSGVRGLRLATTIDTSQLAETRPRNKPPREDDSAK